MPITWPAALTTRRCDLELRSFARTGGRTINGREQRVFDDAGYWEVSYEDIPVMTEAEARAYRAMIARLRAGETINAKVWDEYAPTGVTNYPYRFSGSASIRATTVSLAAPDGVISEGVHFGLGNRVYRVTEVVATSTVVDGVAAAALGLADWDDAELWLDDPSEVSEVKILPPLRVAASSGDLISISNLTLSCVPRSMGEGDLALDVGRRGFASLTLVETI